MSVCSFSRSFTPFYIAALYPSRWCCYGIPSRSNNGLSHHEDNWLNKSPTEFKSRFYKRYADDIFVIFESPESALSFHECLSSKLQNINFTIEQENVLSLSFLDVKISHKNGKFVTSIYRKPTFSEFLPIMKVLFQRIKKQGFYKYYFVGISAYVVISSHFILKFFIWRLSLQKTITAWIS